MKPSISLCMIVRDEEESLHNCINPIKDIADKIIVVDTGSKDKTKDIAKKFTNNVYDFKWCNDFSKARNFSVSKATKDWILVLDADEKIEKNDLIRLKRTIHQQQSVEVGGGELNLPDINLRSELWRLNKFMASNWRVGQMDILGYRLIQKTYYNNKVISIRGICRLFKNNKNIKFIYPIHETVRESIKSHFPPFSEWWNKVENEGPENRQSRFSLDNLKAKIGKTGIVIKHYPKINKEKQKYYLKLLKIKKEKFPHSNVDKEIKNEYNPFNPH